MPMIDDTLRERARAVEEAKKNKKKKAREEKIAEYTQDGKAVKEKFPKGLKVVGYIFIFILAIAAVIYVPPLFYKEKTDSSYTPIIPDASALKTYLTYVKDHPDDDFDNDGLNNTMEDSQGTDVWKVDTDMDGVSDYAELLLTETSPTDFSNTLVQYIMKQDKKNGVAIGRPYKVDDIIFWADDYVAKAYSGVVRTLQGYRIWNFSGWVRFPGKVYAYSYHNGIHHELEHKEIEDAYFINTNDEIRLYDAPLSFVHKLSLPFAGDLYLQDNAFDRFLTAVLPDKGGPVTCRKVAAIDTMPSQEERSSAVIRMPFIDRSDLSRFGKNQNALQDLAKVWGMIDKGQCVAVSMYSQTAGESIGIIYGYTSDGSLLVAGEDLVPAGKITIVETAMKMMNAEGEIGQRSWYDWYGLGFSSYRGDRINFIASTVTAVEDETSPQTEDTPWTELAAEEIEAATEEPAEDEVMPQETEPVTEKVTEPETQEQPKTQPQTEPETKIQEPVTEKQDSVITFNF